MTLVLCRPDGAVLGALPPFPVEVPYFPAAREVVEAARARFGIDVVVLRLLGSASPTAPVGGPVTYLAETADDPPALLSRPPTALPDHPLRLPYACPGGPAADLAWAQHALRDLGVAVSGPAVQHRTWNLSSLWRIPTVTGGAWLKVVPPFLAHEGRLLRLLEADGAAVPRVLATDGPRALLAELPGADLWDAAPQVLAGLVRTLVGIQVRWVDRVDAVLALGAPDWRGPTLGAAVTALIGRLGDRLDTDTRARLADLVAGLPDRLVALAACGLPDTLVHGDFHPGNARGLPGAAPSLLDWGDAGVGHPLLDQPAFLDRVAAPHQPMIRAVWTRCWRAAVPGCDPARAAALLAPLAAARQAVIYQGFLDRIEPAEHLYHAADPLAWLRRAAAGVPRTQWPGPA